MSKKIIYGLDEETYLIAREMYHGLHNIFPGQKIGWNVDYFNPECDEEYLKGCPDFLEMNNSPENCICVTDECFEKLLKLFPENERPNCKEREFVHSLIEKFHDEYSSKIFNILNDSQIFGLEPFKEYSDSDSDY